MPRILRPFLLALLLGGILAPGAQASPSQISIMMDDDQLVYRGDDTAARALAQMKRIGVDTARVTVLWKVVAERARPTAREIDAAPVRRRAGLRRQARRFRGSNPRTYPKRNWDRYDNLVRRATQLGIQVYFNVTGPGPAWAHNKAPASQRRNQPTWKPKAGAYKQFVTAVGRRYDGTYRDENGGVLPRVRFWTLWNEPNQAGWLMPQWERRGGALVPASPALYRQLYQVGYKGLVASGHGGDVILLGETAPLGSSRRTARAPMRPGLFLRELACVDPSGRRYGGRAAAVRSCGDFARRGVLRATGYAHHPYTKNVPPTVRDRNPDALTMANIDDLGRLLDTLSTTTGGAVPRGLPLYMTEFGFETNPPDPFSGVPLDRQAQFNQIGEFQAYQNQRIQAQAQFLLRDVAPVRSRRRGSKGYWFTYQSGLFFQRGQPKPAATAYVVPFRGFPIGTDPVTGTPAASFWGQLRFLPNGVSDVAQIQWRPKDRSIDWQTVGAPVPVDPHGYFEGQRSAPLPVPGEWRAAWLLPDGRVGQFSLSTDAT
ncbi:MAG: hypothetical protein M3296_04185 [Actinomycetota bacterium]|nr:hypothetical protein [Actinomycetota bacterium]